MATTPRIAYDVVANAQGEADVNRLATALAKVDDALDPVAAKRAQELATELQQLGAQRAAIDSFVELRGKADAARAELGRLQQEAQALGKAISQAGVPTRAQAGQLEKLRDAVRAAKAEVQQQTVALDQSRGALSRLGISTDSLASAQVKVRQQLAASAQASQELVQRYQQTATAAQQSAATQVAAQKQVADSVAGIGQQLSRLQGLVAAALGGSFVGQAAGDIGRVADQYNNLAARIRLVTGEGQAFEQAFQGVFDIATRTGTAVEATGNLFARIAQAGKEIGLGQAAALSLTESINQAIQLSGASAASADAAITQLLQGLQSGVLRGEEFNAVLEQSPRLAQALAAGLGVTTGELRKLANQGALTSEVVIKALQGQSAVLKAEFDQLPPTVGRALQNLSTEWTRYIGEVDKSTGASATAAQAIQLLGQNLGTLVETLRLAGQAWLAYKALDLAGTLGRQLLATQGATAAVGQQAAATAAATAATAANTAATAANTAAKAANAAASEKAAASLLPTATAAAGVIGVFGKLLGLVGLVTSAVFLFGDAISSVFRKGGTWIGELAAKLAGYRDRSEEVLAQQQAMEAAARANAAQQAALAQELQRATEKALGLTAASKAIVAEFESVVREGGTAAAALEKVRKSLDLSDIKGIDAAVTALDVLATKGQLTGEQLRAALAQALDGQDLARFEAQARAAFDRSEQGARRVEAALDAITQQALARFGTSLAEVTSGFSAASRSAINDIDALDKALQNAGANATDTGRLLASALDKATSAAATERAVQEVIERLQELGEQGRISGDQLTEGLEKARRKLDELRPGINGLQEALRTFGLKTREELEATASKLGDAYRVIAADVTVSLQDKARAFQQYSEAAIAANGGVESSSVRLQRVILENKLAAAGLGSTIEEAMGRARTATDAAADAQRRYLDLLRSDPDRMVGGDGLGGIGSSSPSPSAGGSPQPSPAPGPTFYGGSGGGTVGSAGGDPGPGRYVNGGFGSSVGEVRYGVGAFDQPSPIQAYAPPPPPGMMAAFGGYVPAPSSRTVTVNLVVGGQRTVPVTTSEQNAEALVSALEQARRAAGG